MQLIGIDDLDQKIIEAIKASPGIGTMQLRKAFPDESDRKLWYRVNTLTRDGWLEVIKTRGTLKIYPKGTV